jgi:hypothetical protein
MATREKQLRPVTRTPRRKTESDGWGDVKDFDVYKCADGYNPFTSTSGAKEELLGRMPYSDNFLKDAAQRFGGGRYLYFIPIDGNGNWGSGKPLYCPKVTDAPDDDSDLRVKVARLEAQLENAKRNGSHSQIADLMAGLRELDTMRAQAGSQKTPLEYLREIKEANELLNPRRESNPAQQQTDNSDLEIVKAFTPLLSSDDASVRENANDIISKFVTKVAKGELSLAEVGMELVRSGQIPTIVSTAISGFGNLFSMFKNAAQAQAPTVQVQQQQPYGPNGYHAQQQPPQVQHQSPAQPLPQAPQQAQQPQQAAQPEQAQMPSPEEQALALLMDHCARNQPAKIAFDRLMAYADAINEQAPAYSIDGYIEMLAVTPTDTVIEFLKTLPNGAQVANMAHTPSWCALLQSAIKSSGFLDQDADEDIAPFDRVTEVTGGNVKL